MRVLTVEFVRSAAGPEGFPRDPIPQVALVGRSNVGKSTLINALAKQTVARTSAAPGKTRLANIYKVRLQTGAHGWRPVENVENVENVEDADHTAALDATEAARPRFSGTLYLVDLPGYGYARGGAEAANEFERLTTNYFEQAGRPDSRAWVAGVVHALDARHPGLPQDVKAATWLERFGVPAIAVATKVDKLSQAERARGRRVFDNSVKGPVLPISAVTGEGLDELWKLIVKLASRQP